MVALFQITEHKIETQGHFPAGSGDENMLFHGSSSLEWD
jgi:hypothetical protein